MAAADLFLDETALKRKFVQQSVAEPVSLDAERQGLDAVFEAVLQKAAALDKSLEGMVGAEQQKARAALAGMEKRLKKAEEQKQETGIQQLLNLKGKLFLEGGLQERTDNFLNFQINHPGFLREIQDRFDPFAFDFQIISLPDNEAQPGDAAK